LNAEKAEPMSTNANDDPGTSMDDLPPLIPEILYTYKSIDDYLRGTLTKRQFWVSNPLSFNDPFDCDLPITKKSSSEKALASVSPLLNTLSFEAKAAVIEAARQGHILGEDEIPAGWRAQMAATGIACFCEAPNDILMWSHYANKHRGVCLGFEKLQRRLDVQKVQYSEKLPRVELADLISPDGIPSMMKFILTKSPHWKYEREWRFFHSTPTFHGDDDPRRNITFYPDELKTVIFGCRLDHKQKEELLMILKDWPTKIHFYEAEVHTSRFELCLQPI